MDSSSRSEVPNLYQYVHDMPLEKSFVNNIYNFMQISHTGQHPIRAPLTYFTDRGGLRDFLGLIFWPKGIFWGL